MKWHVIFKSAVIAVLFLIGCAEKSAIPPEPPVAAWIENTPIAMDELARALQIFLFDHGMLQPQTDMEFRQYITDCLKDLAEENILLREAAQRGIQLRDADLDPGAFVNFPENLPDEFKTLESSHEEWKERVVIRLLTMETAVKILEELAAGVVITEENIKKEYDSSPDRFTIPLEMDIRMIRVTEIQLAQDIRKKLKNGWNFVKLAERFSTIHGEGENGELLRESIIDLPPEFVDALEKSKEQEIIMVSTAENELYLIRIEKKYPEHILPFSEVQDNLREELASRETSSRYRQWIENELTNCNIRMGTPLPFPGAH